MTAPKAEACLHCGEDPLRCETMYCLQDAYFCETCWFAGDLSPKPVIAARAAIQEEPWP